MCHRIAPLSLDELEEALTGWNFGRRATVRRGAPVADAYPGSSVPVAVPTYDKGLQAAVLTWGFVRPFYGEKPLGPKSASTQAPARAPKAPREQLVFNTRLDTALEQLHSGRGLWADPMHDGRCLVPVRAFYEQSATETVPSPRTGKPVKRPYRFTLAGHGVFLLAGVAQGGRFSVVTTEPNAQVAPVHNRMPLVLGPGESQAWLAGDFDALADRSGVELEAQG